MRNAQSNTLRSVRLAKRLWGQELTSYYIAALKQLIADHQLSVISGDLTFLCRHWYVTHSGLLRLATRRHCVGILTQPVLKSCDPANSNWVFCATVFKSHKCK